MHEHLLYIDVNVGSVQRCRLDFGRAQLHDAGNAAAARSCSLYVASCNKSVVVRKEHDGRGYAARRLTCRGTDGVGTFPNLPMVGISAAGADAFLMPPSCRTPEQRCSHTRYERTLVRLERVRLPKVRL